MQSSSSPFGCFNKNISRESWLWFQLNGKQLLVNGHIRQSLYNEE